MPGVKERLVAGVPVGGTVVCGIDDRHTQAMADRAERAGRRVLRSPSATPSPTASASTARTSSGWLPARW